MAEDLRIAVQRGRPFGRLRPRKVYSLALEQVRPVIRIAHRLCGPLHIRERIIFDYELVLCLAGRGQFRFGTEPVRFGPHDLFCIPPFIPHAIDSEAGGSCEHLAVHFDWAPGLPPAALSQRRAYEVRLAHGLHLPRQTRLMAHDQIEQDLLRVVLAHGSASPLGQLEATAGLLNVLCRVLRRHDATTGTADGRDRARMEQAVQMLADPAAAPCRPSALARAVGLSVSHFNRLFREWTGFAPVEYQRRQRIAHARELLADPRHSIKEIAARCGFADPYHFSRVFRQIDGLSPTQYRAARLAGRPRDR
jgi:AraC-like DNA-binding protein/mannose-6-phosphate isomerase-like protein (cupin superfamily)